MSFGQWVARVALQRESISRSPADFIASQRAVFKESASADKITERNLADIVRAALGGLGDLEQGIINSLRDNYAKTNKVIARLDFSQYDNIL